MRSFARTAPLALVATALVGAVSSFAGIDAEVGNGDKITGTLSPATESETFRVRVPNGAKISVKAKAAKKGPALHVVLSYPVAAAMTADGKSASISAVASGSGLYSVTVTSQDGTSTGDYSLTISWKSVATFTKTSDLANAASDTLAFAADAGATATITAKPAKKSKATGILNGLTAPDSSVVSYSTASAKTPLALPGSYSLAFSNAGATQGLVTATVKLKLPKALKHKLDFTSKAIGSGDPKGDAAIAAVLGAAGGTVTVPVIPSGQPGADISGSAVSVPPGSLANGSTIVIGTAPDLTVGTGKQGAGPTVFFGPEGTHFDKNSKTAVATVTIPYDPAYDPASFVIYTRDAKGKVTTVPQPYTIDHSAHTVSFSTSHFSSFRAGGTIVQPQFTLDTLVTLNNPLDVCLAHDPAATGLKVQYYVAGGNDNVVTALRTGAQPGPLVTPETFVGGGAATTDGTPRLQFQFVDPVQSVFATQSGQLFIATSHQIFRLDALGNVHYVAGTGQNGDTGDNGPASAATFTSITSIIVTASQSIYVADSGAHRIRLIQGTGIAAFAGTGVTAIATDGTPLVLTTFVGPIDMDFDGVGPGLYVTDGGRVRHLSPNAAVGDTNVTVAGDAGGLTGSTGDDGPLLSARFTSLQGIIHYIDPFNPNDFVLLVNDTADHTMRKLDLTTNIVTLGAGQHGQPGFGGNLDVSTGLINAPTQLCANANDVIFVDSGNAKIRVQTLLQ